MRGLLILLAMSMLAACAGKQIKEGPKVAPPVESRTVQEPTAPKEAPAAITSTVSEKKVEISPLKDPGNILSKRSVYFDFDKFEVKSEYRPLIEAHARYLIMHPSESVTLQGNADDRGSREYNLALGQKRAVAVKQVMNVLGVPDRQIETISFGEEKPKATGHDEASWAENRRTDVAHSSD